MAATWITCVNGGPRRVNHASVTIGNRIYVIGGYYTGLNFLVREPIDVHVFSLSTLRWSKVQQNCTKNAPFMRYGHTAILYESTLYVWGGRNDIGACNELFAFNLAKSSWSQVQTYGRRPDPRDGHSACLIRKKMYVFGGFVDEPFNVFATGLHALDMETMTWENIIVKTAEPECRDFHAAVAMGDKMYVFGGRGTNTPPHHTDDLTYPNTLHVYDTVTARWSEVPSSPTTPPGRRSLSMFTHGANIYIFGGYNALLDVHFNDLHRFDTKEQKWSVVEADGECPCPRRRQSCVVVADRAYIFGGTSPIDEEGAVSLSPVAFDDDGESKLVDHSDLFILDLRPTLQTLCMLAIIKWKLEFSCLPARLRLEIAALIDPTSVKRPEQRPLPLA